MSDLISRQAAIDALHMDTSIIPFKKAREYADVTISEIRNRLEKLPSAQPERIRGRWIAKEKKNLFRCSKCDAVIYSESEYDRNEFHKFCGRCGADMREEKDK